MGATSQIQNTPIQHRYYGPTPGRGQYHNQPSLISRQPEIRPLSPYQQFSRTVPLGSNPRAAASLVNVQSQAALAITGGQADQGPNPYERGTVGGSKAVGYGIKALRNVRPRGLQKLSALGPGLGIVGASAALTQQAPEAWNSIKTAWNSGKGEDINRAVGSSATAASSAGSLAVSAASVPVWLHNVKTGRAAKDAFRKAVPGATKKVTKAAVKEASKHALKESSRQVSRKAVTSAAMNAAKKTTLKAGAGATSRAAARKALQTGGKAAAKAAGKAVGKGALKTAAKAGARFIPGANIAVAALDAAAMTSTLNDPKANTGKKVTSVVTAAGSALAATNIPIVSQAGAVISCVSSFISGWF
jgi:hypothetical protein